MRMSEKKPYEPVIRWIEPGTGSKHESHPIRRGYRSPTEDQAIGNIMREERKKRRREERQKARKAYEKQKEKGVQSSNEGNSH